MLVRSFRCTQSSYYRRARLGGTQCTPSLPWSPPYALNRAPGHCTNRRIPTQKATERRCNEGLATTQCLICRRVGISAADRTRLTSGQPGPATTTALPAGHVLELSNGCMRISATSGRVHRSVVAGLCPGYRRCRPRPRCRYPNSWPSRYRGSRTSRGDRARGTEYRASWTSTPTSRWATLGRAVPWPGQSRASSGQ